MVRTLAGLTRSPLFRTVIDALIVLLTISIGAESVLGEIFTRLGSDVPHPFSRLLNQWTKDNWVLLAAGLLVLAVVARVISEFRLRSEDKRAKDGIQNHYSVMISELADTLNAKQKRDRLDFFQDFIRELPKHLSGLAGGKHDYVEVQIYQKEWHSDHAHLVPRYSNDTTLSLNHYSQHPGGGSPKYPDEVSKQVWESATEGRTIYHRNLRWWTWTRKKQLPANWKRLAKHRYGTFITVPIRGGNDGGDVVGLLTINSEIPYTLTEIDASLVELAAWMIQIGNEACGYFDTRKTYSGTIRNGPKKKDEERCKF